MSKFSKSQIEAMLDNKYNLLGDLTQSEFIAVKYHFSMDRQITVVHKVDPNSILLQNAQGGWDPADIRFVKPHDNIRINITIAKNGQLQTGTFLVENVKSIKFNPTTGYTMVETGNKAITDQPDIKKDLEIFVSQMEQNADIRILGQLIANGDVNMMEVGADGLKEALLYGDVSFADIEQMIEKAHLAQNRIAEMMFGLDNPTMHDGFNAWGNMTKDEKEREEEERNNADRNNDFHTTVVELE
jgi:hypothetical protein